VTAHPGLQAVLDASALLAYLQGEPGSARVEAALDNAGISAVNLAEVLTTALHKRGLRISNFTA
jgi:PIN domain nuclease of toxin-antitoxin system